MSEALIGIGEAFEVGGRAVDVSTRLLSDGQKLLVDELGPWLTIGGETVFAAFLIEKLFGFPIFSGLSSLGLRVVSIAKHIPKKSLREALWPTAQKKAGQPAAEGGAPGGTEEVAAKPAAPGH